MGKKNKKIASLNKDSLTFDSIKHGLDKGVFMYQIKGGTASWDGDNFISDEKNPGGGTSVGYPKFDGLDGQPDIIQAIQKKQARDLSTIQEQISKLKKAIPSKEEIDEINNKLKNLEINATEFERLKQDIDDYKKKAYEGLTVFVAFFTFVSVDFQFFKEVRCPAQGLAVVLITAALLIGFVLLFEVVILGSGRGFDFTAFHDDETALSKKRRWTKEGVLLLSMCAILVAGISLFFASPKVCQLSEEDRNGKTLSITQTANPVLSGLSVATSTVIQLPISGTTTFLSH
jgi:hypothetical protein